jgi:uncharacterized membrane protein YfcA
LLSGVVNFGKMATMLPDWWIWPALVLLALVVGSYGTLIGAGGGFVLVPILLLIYPDDPPLLITSISLLAVFCNGVSGTAAYVYQRRVDLLAANAFAAATIPGAVIGAMAIGLLPRTLFEAVFGVLMLAAALFLTFRPPARIVQRSSRRGEVTRLITDRHGDTYFFSYSLPKGVGLSLGVGFLSSLLGVGGGIIHVPLMVQALRFPTQIATATSQYVLMITALSGTLVHIVNGDLTGGYERALALSIGVTLGAQVGARVSTHLRGAVIVRLLALALAAISLRLLVGVIF